MPIRLRELKMRWRRGCTLNRDYVDTLKFLHELGVTYVTCSGLITTGNAATPSSEELQLSNDEVKDILDIWEE